MYLLKKLSIQSKLMLILLVVCISSIIAIAYIGYTNGQQALKNSIFNQLISLKESKAYQIETYFQNIRAHIEVMSESPSVVNTMKELKQAYQELEEQPIQSQWNEKLKRYYEQEFLLKLAENVEEKPLLFSYMREFFGEMALLTKSNLSSSLLVTAIEDLEVLMLKTEAVQLILDRVPRLAQEIGAVIETRRKAIQLALKSRNNGQVS